LETWWICCCKYDTYGRCRIAFEFHPRDLQKEHIANRDYETGHGHNK
jgi:hypothetical protein